MPLNDNEVRETAQEYARSGRSEQQLRTYLRDQQVTSDQAFSAGVAYMAIRNNLSSRNAATVDLGFTSLLEASAGRSKIADISQSDTIDVYRLFDPSNVDKFKQIQQEIINQLQRESDLYTEIAEKTGIQGNLLKGYVKNVLDSQIVAIRFGYNIQQVSDFVTTMTEQTGRFNIQSKETLDRSYATGRAFVGSLYKLAEAFSEFEKVGIGAKNALDAIDKSGRSSMSLGLNAKKTTELLKQELGKLNEYGFANGVDGLNRMVQRSIEFRMNMSEVFKIADKVMSPEGAIELTANMQMLGGAIGDLNDPLKLMYMATNNVEGLQEAMMGAVENLATYNEEQKRFEVTGINLRRVREMANALGVDYKELTKGAIAAQERMMAMDDLMGRGLNVSEKDKEFIVNMAKMKDGVMTISLPPDVADQIGTGTEVALSKLSEQQIDKLKGFQNQLVEMSTEDIARGQFTTIKNMANDLKSIVQGNIRGFTRTTLSEGVPGTSMGKIVEDTKIDKILKDVTERQQAGVNVTMKKVEGIIDGAKLLIEGTTNLIKPMFTMLSKELKESVERSISDEEKNKLQKLEEEKEKIKKESQPITQNFKHLHEFKIINTFGGGQSLEYIKSYTESPVASMA